MNEFPASTEQLSVTPLGAGDLIDRAVRFYRHNFRSFVFIAAPPVLLGTLISVGWLVIGRRFFPAGEPQSFEQFFHYLFVWLGYVVIWLSETAATLAVMGGASRNFVRHLLFGEPISFKETYRNTWKRLPGLIVASLIITILLSVVGLAAFYLGLTVVGLTIVLIYAVFSFSPLLTFIFSVVLSLAIIFGALWLFFLAASRFVYVPQIMLVENLGVFAAIGRSATLASGNVKRLAALVIFSVVASYSALFLLYVPLLWAGWANGVEPFTFAADTIPAWYSIANQLIGQTSLILLVPVWMVGLCLLYVDERVRHEGYDLELLAARRLGEIPAVPQNFVNPLQPALGSPQPAAPVFVKQRDRSDFSTLGLK